AMRGLPVPCPTRSSRASSDPLNATSGAAELRAARAGPSSRGYIGRSSLGGRRRPFTSGPEGPRAPEPFARSCAACAYPHRARAGDELLQTGPADLGVAHALPGHVMVAGGGADLHHQVFGVRQRHAEPVGEVVV